MSRSLAVLINSEYSVADIAELARVSEELGYSQFWLTDLPSARDCYLALAAAAASTSRIMLGPGVGNPYSRHPAVTAALIATLDEMSTGRALLGLGVGGAGLHSLGLAPKLPIAAMREAVNVCRRLLAGERVTLDGKIVTVNEAVLHCSPVQDHIPIYFATHGSQMARLAGEITDGVMLANVLVPEALDGYLALIGEGLAKGGRSIEAFTVCLRFEVCLSEDRDAAAAVMRRRVASRLLSQYPNWDYLAQLGVTLPEGFVEIAAAKQESGLARAMEVLPDEVLERTVLFGRAEDVARQVSVMLRPEVTQITVRPHVTEGQKVPDVLTAFARAVGPVLNTSPAVSQLQ